MSPSLQSLESLCAQSEAAVRRGAEALLAMKNASGMWSAPSGLTVRWFSESVLSQSWHVTPDGGGWDPPSREKLEKHAGLILEQRNADGGFPLYPKGPSELDTTIRAYWALKLAAAGADLSPTRDRIVALGGLQAANELTKIDLGMFGLYPRHAVPAVLPELVIANRGRISKLNFRLAGALALIQQYGQTALKPAGFTLDELHAPGVEFAAATGVNGLAGWFRKLGRAAALKEIARLLGESEDHGPAARYVAMALGKPLDEIRLAPSATVETALAIQALAESGCVPAATLEPAKDALARLACRDTNESAQVLAVLRGRSSAEVEGLLGLQSANGGWAASDSPACEHYPPGRPFCDFEEQPSPDVTGSVLEAVCPSRHPAISRAIRFLIESQEQDGSWFGRWGVNYIYGTYKALRGLQAAGESDREAHVLRGGEWLRSIQNADGGWGESCESYANRIYTPAESTSSQTAWAILGLIAGGDAGSLSVQRGIQYLVDRQRRDGTWVEDLATGTEIPRFAYRKNALNQQSLPLLALSVFNQSRKQE